MTSNLQIFFDWRERIKQKLVNLGYHVTFFDAPPSSNNSARVDFKNNSIEATIAVWDRGDVVPEAYCIPNDEFIQIERIEGDDLVRVLNQYLEGIISYSTDASKSD